ncbi:MAG: hypothetical protein ACREOK_08505 [Gemmatimonadaceae bacterium]
MRLFPMIAGFIGAMVGWKVGRLLDLFVAIILSLTAGALAFYYARKYQREMLG